MEEMPVESVLLAFSDRETRKPMPKGKTRPHVLFRELSMRPGKVLPCCTLVAAMCGQAQT